MNYIKHLTGFFYKSNQDQTITPTHISLYLALFQRWNLNRFKNPILISREEMMITAKIKSKATYHKCMKELHQKNYIIYKPSYNPYEGTEVILPDLSNLKKETSSRIINPTFENTIPSNEPNPTKKASKNEKSIPNFEQTQTKNSLVDEQLYINNKTDINGTKTIDISTQKKAVKISSSVNENVPPSLESIKNYFQEKNISELEAEKFFNYYNSNGWLVGGKTPMKDWEAAARNWILNLEKFNRNQSPNFLNPKNLNVSNNKDYAEPL